MTYAKVRESKAPAVPLKEQWLQMGSAAYDVLTIGGALVLMVVALAFDFVITPNIAIEVGSERVALPVMRIFYIHVPSAWIAFLAFGLVALYSILYLMTRKRRWDIYAHGCAEVGVLFCTIVLITGPIWAKPIWGAWWTWDARLTLTLILWFIYLAYLMIRAQDLEPEKKARYSAVLGIVGALSIPINHFSVQLWRTLHPKPVVITEKGMGAGLDDPMFAVALGLTFLALLVAFGALLRQRIVLEELRDEGERLRSRLDERS
ncbi:MAG: cytochrome c biogenesis protein [Nitrospinota bacterium]